MTKRVYKVEPSSSKDFNWMVTVSNGDNKHVMCYINPVFQDEVGIANAICHSLELSIFKPEFII